MYRVIVPILNRKIKLSFNIPVEMGQNTFIEEMNDSYWWQLISETEPIANEYRAILPAERPLCLRIEYTKKPTKAELQRLASVLGFLLNFYGDSGTSLAVRFLAIYQIPDIRLESIYSINWGIYSHFAKETDFNIKSKIDIAVVKGFYDVLDKSTTKSKSLIIALERFNSSMLRMNSAEKLLNLTIAMESLLSAQTEISYKFSLYHSYIATSDPTDRVLYVSLLKKLYTARSMIVHNGDEDHQKVNDVIASMDKYIKLAKKSIAYYAFYLSAENPKNWSVHLDNLVLGKDKRINE